MANLTSVFAKKEIALPVVPALPALPILWIYAYICLGHSKFRTVLIFLTSIPLAAISVATSTWLYPLKLFIMTVLSYWFLSPCKTRDDIPNLF